MQVNRAAKVVLPVSLPLGGLGEELEGMSGAGYCEVLNCYVLAWWPREVAICLLLFLRMTPWHFWQATGRVSRARGKLIVVHSSRSLSLPQLLLYASKVRDPSNSHRKRSFLCPVRTPSVCLAHAMDLIHARFCLAFQNEASWLRKWMPESFTNKVISQRHCYVSLCTNDDMAVMLSFLLFASDKNTLEVLNFKSLERQRHTYAFNVICWVYGMLALLWKQFQFNSV